MAEYYGNALFTLCAGSNARANERLFRERAAWKWRQLQCEIHGQKLINFDTTLDQARVSSPLSSRGWTLQEEFLSPRVLYWFSQNVYWSCAEMQCSEDISPNTNRPLLPDVLIEQRPRQPNVFLSACFEGTDREKLHTEWLTIVESYSRRNLTMASDIFQAISGVAIRYYQVAHKNDRYIAGLWILTFAKELVWKAETAGDHRLDTSKELHSLAPSFSWASLPIEVHVDFQHDFTPSEFFQVAQLRDVRPNKPKEAANDHVKRGSEVKSMQVVGRLTSFWTSYSQVISWSRIDRSSNGVEKLSFAVSRDKDAHAANLENGRLAVYQDHVKEIVAQLDYVEDADRIEKGSLRLLCFEVGRSSLLLLEHLSGDTYRRAGVCYTDRDLFEGVTPKEIKLI